MLGKKCKSKKAEGRKFVRWGSSEGSWLVSVCLRPEAITHIEDTAHPRDDFRAPLILYFLRCAPGGAVHKKISGKGFPVGNSPKSRQRGGTCRGRTQPSPKTGHRVCTLTIHTHLDAFGLQNRSAVNRPSRSPQELLLWTLMNQADYIFLSLLPLNF